MTTYEVACILTELCHIKELLTTLVKQGEAQAKEIEVRRAKQEQQDAMAIARLRGHMRAVEILNATEQKAGE